MKAKKNQREFDQKIKQCGMIAVCQIASPEEAVATAKKLLLKNVHAMEIAYRNPDNLALTDRCITAVRLEVPEMLLGAATVTSPKLARRAKKAGAQFVLSAGFNECTVRYCVRRGIPVFPGTATPGEIERAISYGLCVIKVFPVSVLGGKEYLAALYGPYPKVSFIVSGGINANNAAEYSSLPNVAAVSGSWLSK